MDLGFCTGPFNCCVVIDIMRLSVSCSFIETKIPEPAMKDLVNEVHTTNPYNFGLQLNISNFDLDVIMSNKRDHLREQLREVLNTYLRQTPRPSWYQVALALQNIGDITNAAEIAQKYGT